MREEFSRAYTRRERGTQTRLDRWYVPYEDEFEDVLWTVSIRDDLVWKDTPTDHSLVSIQMEIAKGERGHERKTAREDLIADLSNQNIIADTLTKAYGGKGTQIEKFEKAMRMIKHEIMKMTDQARKRDDEKARKVRTALMIITRMAQGGKASTEHIVSHRRDHVRVVCSLRAKRRRARPGWCCQSPPFGSFLFTKSRAVFALSCYINAVLAPSLDTTTCK